jgi:hypothetical protein
MLIVLINYCYHAYYLCFILFNQIATHWYIQMHLWLILNSMQSIKHLTDDLLSMGCMSYMYICLDDLLSKSCTCPK